MTSTAARRAFGEPCLRLSGQRVVHGKNQYRCNRRTHKPHTHTRRIRARVVQHDFWIGNSGRNTLGRVALSDDFRETGGCVQDNKKQIGKPPTVQAIVSLVSDGFVVKTNGQHTSVYTRTQSTNEQDNDISSFSLAEIPCADGGLATWCR